MAGGRRRREPRARGAPPPGGRRLAALALTALGVVYGDIGTSPLYAFRECFKPAYGLPPTEETIHGVLSLITWSLILIVSVKYLTVVIRLDNRGEGGIMALLAMVPRIGTRRVFVGLGLFGAALLYGDGIITPAISVLSAAEGLEIAAPGFAPYVLPTALLVLFLLFRFQHYGTARVGGVFGPVMLIWFATIGALGTVEIVRRPAILLALAPWPGARLFWDHGWSAFLVLGGVVLTVTGAEALYADLGHFGRRPIRLAWFALVFPALLLNYFGQGALVLGQPEAIASPFYLLAPRAMLYPLVGIATAATVVASQALISGVFSLTQQGISLRYIPRMSIIHTSRFEAGQVYLPAVNTALMVGCLLLVIGFRSSAALGGAYGVAVTGTMATTTVLFYAIARYRWRWSGWSAGALTVVFLAVDLAFLAANVGKIAAGAWVPLVVAGAIVLVMTTWHRGSDLVMSTLSRLSMPLDVFLRTAEEQKPPRVPGTAVFLTPTLQGAPLSLVRHFRHNKVLHEEVILVSIVTEEVPEVEEARRMESEPLGFGFWRVRAHYGFLERPDVQWVVARCCDRGMSAAPEETTFFLGRASLLPVGSAPMPRWRKRLFALMSWNASSATDFFQVPPDQVLEVGARIEF
ncbi:MAG TPA: potassium transporter Kup [Gemmatimonadales bacterium]|nr:potassium transporter Kup [Gemmatimonadales bacterium]